MILREKKSQDQLANGNGHTKPTINPRWVRINNILTTIEEQLATTFYSYRKVKSLVDLVEEEEEQEEENGGKRKPKDKDMKRGHGVYIDPHIPDLIAVAAGTDLSTSPAYKKGEIILQDKASCFPAYLLVGERRRGSSRCTWSGDLIDACAAPGNKTTHMASLLARQEKNQKEPKNLTNSKNKKSKIFAMDASIPRSKTLQKLVSVAGADEIVSIFPGQDFLAGDPGDKQFQSVTGLLLDPSCSGSGIIGRDDVPRLALPDTGDPGLTSTTRGAGGSKNSGNRNSKKRKRGSGPGTQAEAKEEQGAEKEQQAMVNNMNRKNVSNPNDTDENYVPLPLSTASSSSDSSDLNRLSKLASLQVRIVEHAMHFPGASCISYSTCSVHSIENENVVARILRSDVAKHGRWRIMRRDEQPEGLREWKYRGIQSNEHQDGGRNVDDNSMGGFRLSDSELEGCLRCWPGEEGLGGFFVAGFVRDISDVGHGSNSEEEEEDDDDDEWEGFSD